MASRRFGSGGLELRATAFRRSITNQVRQEWRASAVHAAFLNRIFATELAGAARDFRPPDLGQAREMLNGRINLAGETLEIGPGGDPWDRPSPSRRFATELHRFVWAPGLIASGEAGRREALRLVLDWLRLFGRPARFSWGEEVLERRVFNLACAARSLCDLASDTEAAAILTSLARQALALGQRRRPSYRAAEAAAASALALTVLNGAAVARPKVRQTQRLAVALERAVLPDGGLQSRSPEQGMELLLDLLSLDDLLLQRGLDASTELSRSIDRLTASVRFYTLSDGRLAAFQGGGASTAARVEAAVAHEEAPVPGAAGRSAPHGGFHRLNGRTIQVMVDAAEPAAGDWSLGACAQALALEVTCGPDRLIVNSGWTPDALAAEALRLTPAASTATVQDGSAGSLLRGLPARVLGSRLVNGARQVEAHRETDDTGLWLEARHEGWAKTYGLIHLRRLFLDARLDELRGEDRFEAAAEGGAPVRHGLAFAIRFHLPPDVQVSLARDQRSALLRGPSSRGWWLRNDANEVALEPSTHVEAGLARRSAQIVLRGRTTPTGDARVRWKLAPVEPG